MSTTVHIFQIFSIQKHEMYTYNISFLFQMIKILIFYWTEIDWYLLVKIFFKNFFNDIKYDTTHLRQLIGASLLEI